MPFHAKVICLSRSHPWKHTRTEAGSCMHFSAPTSLSTPRAVKHLHNVSSQPANLLHCQHSQRYMLCQIAHNSSALCTGWASHVSSPNPSQANSKTNCARSRDIPNLTIQVLTCLEYYVAACVAPSCKPVVQACAQESESIFPCDCLRGSAHSLKTCKPQLA